MTIFEDKSWYSSRRRRRAPSRGRGDGAANDRLTEAVKRTERKAEAAAAAPPELVADAPRWEAAASVGRRWTVRR